MNILKNLRTLIEIELEATYILAPIFISIGIIIFFLLPYDPSLLCCCIPILVALVLTYIFKSNHIIYRLCLLIVITSIGFLACEFRVITVNAPRINEQLQFVEITGSIVQITDTKANRKLLLDNLEIEGIDKTDTPKFVRISLKTDISNLTIGDRIELVATLMPPPHPTIPGGFNFAEYTYFKRIGAIGYATSKPHVISNDTIDSLTKHINRLRKSIGDKIESRINALSSSIALALLVGDTSKIPLNELTIIRTSGIAHIIAISGLHVVIIVGLIFISTRFLLSRSTYLTNRYDLKKTSATLGIIGSFIYLIIAGSPISAQRAFVMSTIALFAITIDRNSNPMRSIATAAIVILLLTPESLFTPSLQMSFAACIALISGFAVTQSLFKASSKSSSKIWFYFLGIVISTLLAGAATTPFVIYHFNQFSTYSLLTNLFAIPLTNFIIMPLGIASLLLMPINLDWLTLIPMSWAIDLLLSGAYAVSTLPEAYIHIVSYSAFGIGFIALGGAMLCMMRTSLRALGIPIILAGMLSNNQLFVLPKPDLMIDSKGKLFAIKMDDTYYFSNKISARFVRKAWEQHLGITEPLTIRDLNNCNSSTCNIKKNGQSVAIIFKDSSLSRCDTAINLTDVGSNCNEIINKKFLSKEGNTFVWLNTDGIEIQTVAQGLKKRVWNHFKF